MARFPRLGSSVKVIKMVKNSKEKDEIIPTKFLKSNWFRYQIETHLIFGPISRHTDFAWFSILIISAFFLKLLFNPNMSIGCYLTISVLFCLFVGPQLIMWSKLTRYQQAAIGWISVKVSFCVASLFLMTLGPIVSNQRGQTDGLPLFLLGLVWLPWLEFIPKITPHQKYVTILRLIISIPVIFMGNRTGYWHWGGP